MDLYPNYGRMTQDSPRYKHLNNSWTPIKFVDTHQLRQAILDTPISDKVNIGVRVAITIGIGLFIRETRLIVYKAGLSKVYGDEFRATPRTTGFPRSRMSGRSYKTTKSRSRTFLGCRYLVRC
jgi:hypothetical protein